MPVNQPLITTPDQDPMTTAAVELLPQALEAARPLILRNIKIDRYAQAIGGSIPIRRNAEGTASYQLSDDVEERRFQYDDLTKALRFAVEYGMLVDWSVYGTVTVRCGVVKGAYEERTLISFSVGLSIEPREFALDLMNTEDYPDLEDLLCLLGGKEQLDAGIAYQNERDADGRVTAGS